MAEVQKASDKDRKSRTTVADAEAEATRRCPASDTRVKQAELGTMNALGSHAVSQELKVRPKPSQRAEAGSAVVRNTAKANDEDERAMAKRCRKVREAGAFRSKTPLSPIAPIGYPVHLSTCVVCKRPVGKGPEL